MNEKVRKVLKITLINIVFLIFLVISFETYFCIKNTTFWNKKFNGFGYLLKKEKFENKFNDDFKKEVRKPQGLKYKKKPILFLGCSNAYGQFLEEEETLSYKISKKAKRPVYNWAYPAWGIQHAYYIIQNMPKIQPEPEYVFYVFINDHLRRMYMNCFIEDYAENLQYKLKDGKLEKIDNRSNIFDNSYFLVNLKKLFIYFYKKSENSQNLFLNYVYQLNDEVKTLYPHSKFVILVFEHNNKKKKGKLQYKLMEELQKNRINVVFSSKITDVDFSEDKYRLPKEKDSFRHPNALTWDIVSDALIKEFDL